jgi:hypothetical protein
LARPIVNERRFCPREAVRWIKTRFVDEWPNWAFAKAQVDELAVFEVVNERHFYPAESSTSGVFVHARPSGG